MADRNSLQTDLWTAAGTVLVTLAGVHVLRRKAA